MQSCRRPFGHSGDARKHVSSEHPDELLPRRNEFEIDIVEYPCDVCSEIFYEKTVLFIEIMRILVR